MAVQIPFPIPSTGYALNSKLRVNLDFLVDKFNEFNTGTATWDTVAIGTANSLTGTLTFYNSSNANYLTIQPGVTGANVTLTLPTDDGDSGEFLQTNGSGVLSWEPPFDAGLAGYLAMYDGATFGASSSDLQAFLTVNSNLIRVAMASHAGLGASRIYTIPNAGASAQFIMSEGSHSINGNLDILSPNYLATAKVRIVSDSTLEMQKTNGSGYTIKWPGAQSSGTQYLQNDGSGNLSWVSPTGSGTVNTGTAGRLAIYPSTGDTVDDQATVGSGTIDIVVASLAANRSYTIPDAGGTASFVMNAGNSSIAGVKTFSTASGIVMQAAGTQELLIDSTDNSANNSYIFNRVGGASAGDPYHLFTISGVTAWALGVDNSDSDSFCIANATSLGTNLFRLATTGAITVGGAVASDTDITDDLGTSSVKWKDIYCRGIVGTTTNDAAQSGSVGEYVESVVGNTSFPSTGTFGDLTSISLTAGDWDVTAGVHIRANGATVTSVQIGISTNSGNDATGLTNGSNSFNTLPPTAASNTGEVIPVYRISLSGTTTVYFKYTAVYTVATPTAAGRLSARRIR